MLFVLSSLVSPICLAEESGYKEPSIGLAEFQRSCAVCHGLNAKGNGVMADTLKRTPADLTTLSKRNGGQFPHEKVYQTIEGLDDLAAHGTRDMLIWGQEYKREARRNFENEFLYARGRMFELIFYLESIQE